MLTTILLTASILQSPEERPFRMGFTPWPSELSVNGLETSAKFLRENADLVSIMLIGGVPWQEALEGKPYSADVQRQLRPAVHPGAKVFLSISPLDMNRRGLAPYWGERDNMPLPSSWSGLAFDDPKVVKALTRFTLDAVAQMKPDYLAIGVESNALLSHDRKAWPTYVKMHQAVYKSVKAKHPNLPVFFTTEVNHYLERMTESKGSGQKLAVKELMEFSDWFAMSYYPHMTFETRYPIRSDFFGFATAFGKPIAISETGMSSRPVKLTGLELLGDEEKQRQYYEVLLSAAKKDKYRFVTTFCTTDFDRLLPQLPEGMREIGSIWAWSGLQTSDQQLKPAGKLWRDVYARPLQP